MESPTSAPLQPVRRPNILRRMYYWVLSWADTPYGVPALAVISFLESSVFPIPPDVLQIALSVSRPQRAFLYAAVSTVASILGAILGWVIGYMFWEALGNFFFDYIPGFTHEKFDFVGKAYQDNAVLALLAAAFTPIPFKIFTVAAGVFHQYVPLSTLILTAIVGRSARFFAVATCIYFLGPWAKAILEKYFEVATLLLFVLLVLGFLSIRWLMH